MPVIVQVQTNQFRDVLGRFASVRNETAVAHSRAHVQTAARMLQQALREEAPRGTPDPLGRPRRYPVLWQSIWFQTVRSPKGWAVEFRAAPQVRFVLGRTRPHEIRGRRCPLHFYWHRMGVEAWFWSVNHPGTRPNRFDLRAARRVKGRMTTEMRRGARAVALMFMGRRG